MLTPDQQAVAVRAYGLERIRAAGLEPDPVFADRLGVHLPRLLDGFTRLYGERADCLERLGDLLVVAARADAERPSGLKALDAARAADPRWYQDQRVLGGVCYVDRYAGDLTGLRARITYFR